MQKHGFVPRKFRMLRLPILFLVLTPSIILEGIIVGSFFSGTPICYLITVNEGDYLSLVKSLAAAFVFLQSWPILFYLRLRGQRAKSFIIINDKIVTYRKSKLMGLLKTDWKNGYAFNDDIEIIRPNNIKRTLFGGIVVSGIFKKVRRLPGTDAYYSDSTVRRIAIPSFYEDMDGIAERLNRLKE